MSEKRVVMVVDMQKGCLKPSSSARKVCLSDQPAYAGSRHGDFYSAYRGRGLEEGSEGFALLPELHQPAGALYVTKTACDAFYNTGLETLLREHGHS
jgi:nicotinamidase-related amidase